MTWSLETSVGNESAKIRWELVPFTKGKVLELGCGSQKAFPHFIGVDNGHHQDEFGMKVNADLMVETCEDLGDFASQRFDAVFSSHLLEHIKDHKAALREWWRVIKPGGYLCLYLPHKDLYPNIGHPGSNPDHKHDFYPEDIIDSMPNGFDLVVNEVRNEGNEYSFFQVYKKLKGDKNRFSYKDPKPTKTAAVCRYGGIGDMIQASSVLPGLKAQGFHVTVYTTEAGKEIIREDPHVDAWVIQEKDQVPNHLLNEFWEYTAKKYDRFINFSESVEGALLALPGRIPHSWPDEVRRKHFNKNYLEFSHDIAQVPLPPRQAFYPTPDEVTWAKRQVSNLNGFVILWSLSGSSVHKSWPHLDTVIARLMIERPHVRVILCGDELCQLLERGWEKEVRVKCMSGKLSIRQSLTLAKHVNLVVGTETGLLNAVGLDEVPKVITLSHSSVENLTKHWKNTESLTPPVETTPCYPCHRMQFGFKYCHQDEETGTAICQKNITAEMMYAAILKWVDHAMLPS